jgi:hypothetical protein
MLNTTPVKASTSRLHPRTSGINGYKCAHLTRLDLNLIGTTIRLQAISPTVW